MRGRRLILLALPAAAAASGPVQSRTEPVELALSRAQQEARTAEAEEKRLQALAAKARNAAEELRARQAAAAQAIAAAEARISAAGAQQGLIKARLALLRQRLERRQQPVRSLLAGLAMMAERPPLLALAGGADSDEMVKVRVLLDATLPAIRSRTSGLASELTRLEQLEQGLAAASLQLARSRSELEQKRLAFAELETRALQSEAMMRGGALSAGDAAIAAADAAELLAGDLASSRDAAALAREVAQLGPAPLPDRRSATIRPPFAYRLPAAAPVVQGFGEVNASGIRSRGITLATRQGAAVAAPATGIIRFAGPFRDYDGIVIIDHGGGWMSLIVNVASPLRAGARVAVGAPLGRALGAIEVELSTNGGRVSPALIAGSSATLSNRGKDG